MHILEVVPGDRRAVLGVSRRRSLVGDGVVAPDVVAVLVDLARGAAVGGVDGVALAAQQVAHLVTAGDGIGAQCDVTRIQGSGGAGGGGGMTVAPALEDPAVAGVDDVGHVGVLVAQDDLPCEARSALAARIHHQRAGRQLGEIAAELRTCGDNGIGRPQRGTRGQIQGRALGERCRLEAAVARVHDQIAADHRQPGVGAVEADMLGAVGVDDHITGEVLVVDRGRDRATMTADQIKGTADGRMVACIGGYRFAGAEREHHCQRQQLGIQRHVRATLR